MLPVKLIRILVPALLPLMVGTHKPSSVAAATKGGPECRVEVIMFSTIKRRG